MTKPALKASKLVLNGGEPIRKTMLPYGHQLIEDDDIQAVISALKQDMITRGPSVEGFERAVAEFVKMPYAVAFSSATAALHAVYALLGVKEGVRVVTTPNTFAATSNAVLYCGGTVEFQDVCPKTLNLDADGLKNLNGVRVVTAVDFSGNPCDYEALSALKKKYGFKLVDDASHSLGGTLHKKPVGGLADISIFSFHPVKTMTTGEGGMVVVRDVAEAEFLRQFRGHGIVRTNIPGFYRQESLGFNYNITDIQCALGTSQLKKLPKWVSRRNEIAEKYHAFFRNFEALQIPQVTSGAVSAWHLYPLRLRLDKLSCNREGFLRALHAENIGANVHYIPVHWHPYYQSLGFQRGLCPIAEAEYLREVSLPLFPGMTERDIVDVCQAVEKIVTAYGRSN